MSLQSYGTDLLILIVTAASKINEKKNKIYSYKQTIFLKKNCKSEFCLHKIVNDSDFNFLQYEKFVLSS